MEAIIIVILLLYAGFATYLWASKQNQTVVNQKDSHPTIAGPRTDWPFSIHIGEGGCARVGTKTSGIN